MNSLGPKQIRKMPHNRCYGMEIEMLTKSANLGKEWVGFWLQSTDGSIRSDSVNLEKNLRYGVEMVSQPLPYSQLVNQITTLDKRMGGWGFNYSCGIHIHVGRSWVSFERLGALAEGIKSFNRIQIKELFGRAPNNYCENQGYSPGSRYRMINFTNKETIEFRMFASGDAAWAKECLRRTKLMCFYKGKVTYENLLNLFTKPD